MTPRTAPRLPDLLLPLLTFLTFLLVYATLWVGWTHHWVWVDATDARALTRLHHVAESHGWWVPVWHGLSTVAGPAAWRILVAVPVVLELWRRRAGTAAFLAVSVWGSGIVTTVAKHLADRDRPDTQLVAASGSSFPSGHALGVLVAVGALLLVYAPSLRRGRRTAATAAIAAGVVVCLLIGVARVALNVHHPSDVLAGWALGSAWLLICVGLCRAATGAGTRAAPAGGRRTRPATSSRRPPRRGRPPSGRRSR